MDDLYHEEELRSLFRKYLHKQCTEEEVRLLMTYSDEPAFRPLWEELLSQTEEDKLPETQYKSQIDLVYARIIQSQRQQPFIQRYWWAAAASVFLLIAAGIFFWPRQTTIQQPVIVQQRDVSPGADKALLTLADGSVIALDSAGQQTLQQGDAHIRQQGGMLVYDIKGQAATISYNKLQTPRGGEFRITLPDGSNVWLNAASSLRYPTAFTGKERVVEITGEAFFEIAQNANAPFKVKVAGKADIIVLGTSFNVNAYEDEPTIKTTLVTGAININAANQTMIMAPGQQVALKDGHLQQVPDASIAQAIAWKEGFFSFQKADLPTVLRTLARWYDLDVAFEGNSIAFGEYTGDIDRSLTLTQVLKGLAKNRLHYRIENGRKLIILP